MLVHQSVIEHYNDINKLIFDHHQIIFQILYEDLIENVLLPEHLIKIQDFYNIK